MVEGDRRVRDVLCETLKSEGFPAEGVDDVATAENLLEERGPYRAALVAVDDGKLAQKIRSKHRTPVVLLRKPIAVNELFDAIGMTARFNGR